MNRWQRFNLLLLSMFYVAAGTNHFLMPEAYQPMMPPYVPWHSEMIFFSGVFEVLLGIFVIFPTTRSFAGYGLVLLLVAVFPANIHMALHPELFPIVSPLVLWARLPLQILLIYWGWASTRSAESYF